MQNPRDEPCKQYQTIIYWEEIQFKGALKEIEQTRRRMARERRGAGSSLVSMETQY